MAKREQGESKRERKPDPGLDTCPECGGVITWEDTALGRRIVTPMGAIHDCAVWFIMRGALWGRLRHEGRSICKQ